jgi:hypothetical protein
LEGVEGSGAAVGDGVREGVVALRPGGDGCAETPCGGALRDGDQRGGVVVVEVGGQHTGMSPNSS